MRTATAIKTKPVGIRMPETWNDQLFAIAAAEGKTRNDIVLRAIALLFQEVTPNKGH
ncbi:hypothetical protein NDI52_32310 [Leptolyngbya sp. PL-A3]|uniref:hypothetical protein n=1 Tax=Leptolyngbya sp. PL-A3 TaxID=2933911 RepID=UPI00329A7167